MPTDDRSAYSVDIYGIPHTMLLTAEHAELYGDAATAEGSSRSKSDSKAQAPANKAQAPSNKGA